MPRRPKEKLDIDVVPYLSIMVIVLKLICLILVVTVMRIALNPHGVKAVAIENLYGVERKGQGGVKAPTYFDCGPDGVLMHPGEILVSPSELMTPGNPIARAIDNIKEHATNQYAIVLVRPRSTKEYRVMRKLLTEAKVDVGYDIFDADVKVNFRKSAAASGITLPEETPHAETQKR